MVHTWLWLVNLRSMHIERLPSPVRLRVRTQLVAENYCPVPRRAATVAGSPLVGPGTGSGVDVRPLPPSPVSPGASGRRSSAWPAGGGEGAPGRAGSSPEMG